MADIPPADTLLQSYEDVPYDCKPGYPTHPDCLATLGTVMGLSPPPPERCRVLELGCANGGNLIGMAAMLPEARFVGVDLSPGQVAAGRRVIEGAGLTNVELRAGSLTDVDASWGTFDYVICHGVYSWVPPAIQDRILTICRQNLAPDGLAYVSYNTYPGWHHRRAVRDMLKYHVARYREPAERIGQARAFLEFLAKAIPDRHVAHKQFVNDQADAVRIADDSYLYHEHLEDDNEPLYFSEFVSRASAKGLRYVGEAWYHSRTDSLPEEVRDTLQGVSDDVVALEQYLDFLNNRPFRRTVLCHAERDVPRRPAPEALWKLHVTGLAAPVSESPDLSGEGTEEFRAEATVISTNQPFTKTLLADLYQSWPRAVPVQSVLFRLQQQLYNEPTKRAEFLRTAPSQLYETLLRFWLSHVVALHVCPPAFTLEPGERPRATPLARYQARTNSKRFFNLRHQPVPLEGLDQLLVGMLDGTRDREQLANEVADQVVAGALELTHNGEPVRQRDLALGYARAHVDPSLRSLARKAMLVA